MVIDAKQVNFSAGAASDAVTEYIKGIYEGKTFECFTKDHDITIVAKEDGTVDDLIKKASQRGWTGTHNIKLKDGSNVSFSGSSSVYIDVSGLKNEIGTHRVYLDGDISGMQVNTPEQRAYYDVHIVPFNTHIDEAYYMKNHYPDTYETMTELPQEVLDMDFSKAKSMEYFFAGCKSLKKVPALNTKKCQSFGNMFLDCEALESVGDIDITSAGYFSSMFKNCTSLKEVGMTFKRPKPKDISSSRGTNSYEYMFQNCSSLEELPPINCSNIGSFTGMFLGCNSLKEVVLYNCPSSPPTKGTLDKDNTTTFTLITSTSGF